MSCVIYESHFKDSNSHAQQIKKYHYYQNYKKKKMRKKRQKVLIKNIFQLVHHYGMFQVTEIQKYIFQKTI